MGVEVAELRRRRDEVTQSDLTSLNTLVLSDDETTIERIDTIASKDETVDPLHAAAKEEAKDKFRAAFARLPQREREVAVLLYVKNMTLAEIGEILGVSESRVCQIHGAAQAHAAHGARRRRAALQGRRLAAAARGARAGGARRRPPAHHISPLVIRAPGLSDQARRSRPPGRPSA